jgi:hypothetical protein
MVLPSEGKEYERATAVFQGSEMVTEIDRSRNPILFYLESYLLWVVHMAVPGTKRVINRPTSHFWSRFMGPHREMAITSRGLDFEIYKEKSDGGCL